MKKDEQMSNIIGRSNIFCRVNGGIWREFVPINGTSYSRGCAGE